MIEEAEVQHLAKETLSSGVRTQAQFELLSARGPSQPKLLLGGLQLFVLCVLPIYATSGGPFYSACTCFARTEITFAGDREGRGAVSCILSFLLQAVWPSFTEQGEISMLI